MEEKYLKIKQIVEKELSSSSHDIDHTLRVYNIALRLAEGEEIDLDVLKTATLLHDIARTREFADKTGGTDHAILGAEMAEKILKDLEYPNDKINHIKECIISHRSRTDNKPKSKEAIILFDADKLEVLGAIGIAKAFMVAGKYGQKIYQNTNLNEYIKKILLMGTYMEKLKMFHNTHLI